MAYIRDRCRCADCRTAAAERERATNRAHAYGRYDGLVDADPVRAHVRALTGMGVGLKQITRLSGVSGGTLNKLMYGHPLPGGGRRAPSRRCSPRTADRILGLPLDRALLAGGALVDGTGTRRRLQALVARGWSQRCLARKLGVHEANFSKTVRATEVLVSTARAVAALYDELWDCTPVAVTGSQKIAVNRARRMAHERGWLPPLAWDDIDDPDETPTVDLAPVLDEIAVERAMVGDPVRLTKLERDEVVRRLTARGVSAWEIGRRLRTTGRTVQRRRAA